MRRTRTRLGLAALLFIAVFGIAGLWLRSIALTSAGRDRRTMVIVPEGFGASAVGKMLEEKGIIRSSLGFKLLARVTGLGSQIKPGAYDVSPAMTPKAILSKIAGGEVSARWITFPEGYTVVQMGERLQARKMGNAERFIELAQTGGSSFSTPFPHPGSNLEGYLFPDTYLVPIGASEEVIVQQMLDNFNKRVAAPMAADVARSKLDLHNLVTLASLVEREARVPKDRPLIAAVLTNRLRKNMLLQCDATVLYALGRHSNRVLYRDLEVESPYNTYKYPGLPPGPIANPGRQSVEAALHPASVGYLYYVAKADGSHIFTSSFSDHSRAVQVARHQRSRLR